MAKPTVAKTNTGLLDLDNIAVRGSGRAAFPRTCWTWRRGEQWAILGPNGSGKSLLALALCGRVPLLPGKFIIISIPPPGMRSRNNPSPWFRHKSNASSPSAKALSTNHAGTAASPKAGRPWRSSFRRPALRTSTRLKSVPARATRASFGKTAGDSAAGWASNPCFAGS